LLNSIKTSDYFVIVEVLDEVKGKGAVLAAMCIFYRQLFH